MLETKSIYDLTTFTHLDYQNHLSCIVWFSGCNMRCDYCYNPDIVKAKDGIYSYDDILAFLYSRVGLLDAVVLSGGEASLHELVDFCQKVKELGFKIKLDTNGINYTNIKELINLQLLDFISLDYKSPKHKFKQITKSSKFHEFSKTLTMLIENSFDFEVRTTIHRDLISEDDINEIIEDLIQRGYTNNYYLQNFLETDNNLSEIKSSKINFDTSLLNTGLRLIWR